MALNFEDQYSLRAHLVEDSLPTLDLLGPLYAALTLLSVLSVRALTRRSNTRRARPTVIILCLTIFTLLIATTTDLVTYIISTQLTVLEIIRDSGGMPPNPTTLADHLPLQNCVSTAAMTINITLGDAIVCWRACVIWRRNHIVRVVCGVFVLTTFVLGVIDTWQGYRLVVSLGAYASSGTSGSTQIGTLYGGVPVGIAACVTSLGTNLIATLLVAYKAWQNRQRLRGYLSAGSQVEKLFALLIESGVIYWAMWVLLVTLHTAENEWEYWTWFEGPSSNGGPASAVVFGVTVVHVVAIYPMIILVLVAQGWSHIERGLSQHLEPSVPTPHLAVVINTIVTSEDVQCWRSGVLVIGPDGQGLEHKGKVEEADTRTSKEWKSEAIA